MVVCLDEIDLEYSLSAVPDSFTYLSARPQVCRSVDANTLRGVVNLETEMLHNTRTSTEIVPLCV